mgnify:CR=1 FL=1
MVETPLGDLSLVATSTGQGITVAVDEVANFRGGSIDRGCGCFLCTDEKSIMSVFTSSKNEARGKLFTDLFPNVAHSGGGMAHYSPLKSAIWRKAAR